MEAKMTDSNNHISEFLDYYLEKETSPDYAVLITGCWGSGKTYFIRKYLKGKGTEKDSVKVFDWLTGCEKYTVVYASLFGAKNRKEMDQRVLEKLHPILNSAVFKALPNAVSLVGKISSEITGNSTMAIADKTVSVLARSYLKKKENLNKKTVVVFDDVERADMPLPELLGYLNEYVEHLHIPCILLADKEKWEEAQKCQEDKSTLHRLSSTKEKVIGKEFQIRTTFDEVWNCWFDKENQLLNDKSNNLLKDYQDVIAQIFEMAGVSNFRPLKHSLLDFQRFIEKIQDEYLKNSEFNKLLVADFFAHQYAYYLGMFTASEIGSSNEAAREMARIRARTYQQSNKLKEEELEKKYPILPYEAFEKLFKPLPRLSTHYSIDDYSKKWTQIWLNWFLKNFISINDINNIIKNSIWFDLAEEYYLKQLLNWFMLDDENGERALNAFEESLKHKTLVDPFLIMNLFYQMYWYATQNVLKDSPENFKSRMEEYVKSVKDKLIDRDMENWKQQGWIDSTYNENKDVNDKFLALLRELLSDKIQNRKKKLIDEFYTLLQSDSYSEVKRMCDRIALFWEFSKKFPFTELDVQKLCDAYQKINKDWRRYFFNALKRRYAKRENENEWNGELIESEKNFLEKLLETAKDIYDNAERPLTPTIFSLYYLIRTLEEILKQVQNHDPRN